MHEANRMMLLTREQIERSTAWLVDHGSPAVRYLTQRHLVGADPRSPELSRLWEAVESSAEVVGLFRTQKPDGSWCSANPWAAKPSYIPAAGYSPFTPKYVTTIWVLSVLGDMGFTVEHPRIQSAAQYVLEFQHASGLFSRGNVRGRDDPSSDAPEEYIAIRENAPCELGTYLTALGKVGMGNDERLGKSYDLLIRWQREDGGWILQKHKEERNWWRSCPHSSHGATMALYYSGRPEHRQALCRGLRFLVWHLALKPEAEIRSLFYHGHNTVKELLALSELGTALSEPPVRALLEWLSGMYDADEAHFTYPAKRPTSSSTGRVRYHLYHLAEDDWLTYYATRIAVNLRRALPDV